MTLDGQGVEALVVLYLWHVSSGPVSVEMLKFTVCIMHTHTSEPLQSSTSSFML